MQERAGLVQSDTQDGGSWVFWIYDANMFEKGPVENVWRRRWKVITITLSARIRAALLETDAGSTISLCAEL